MTFNYEVVKIDENCSVIKKTFSDSETISWIPMVEGNSDYQAYLADPTGAAQFLTNLPTGDVAAPTATDPVTPTPTDTPTA